MKLRVLALAAALLAPATAGSAENDSLTYTIYVYGFKLGVLRLELAQTDSRYAAAGRVTTTGLMSKIAKFDFDGKVKGHRENSEYWPDEFSATIFNKSSESTVRMTYNSRTPKLVEYAPERAARETDVNPAKQHGAVDLISSAYMILRDVPREQLCGKSVQMFDGRRRSQIREGKPIITGDKARCSGYYQRLAGFSESEMAEQTTFPFMLFYEMQKDGNYRLMSIETESVVGSAKMVRRD